MTLTEFEKRAAYQNGYDREFEGWKIIDVHQIPTEFHEGHEVDFYCSNGETVFLLRLRHKATERYDVNTNSKALGHPPYLIAEFPIEEIDTNIIKDTLKKFDR